MEDIAGPANFSFKPEAFERPAEMTKLLAAKLTRLNIRDGQGIPVIWHGYRTSLTASKYALVTHTSSQESVQEIADAFYLSGLVKGIHDIHAYIDPPPEDKPEERHYTITIEPVRINRSVLDMLAEGKKPAMPRMDEHTFN